MKEHYNLNETETRHNVIDPLIWLASEFRKKWDMRSKLVRF